MVWFSDGEDLSRIALNPAARVVTEQRGAVRARGESLGPAGPRREPPVFYAVAEQRASKDAVANNEPGAVLV
eukprot:15448757-Alexandrium_andersonii.AAC.1